MKVISWSKSRQQTSFKGKNLVVCLQGWVRHSGRSLGLRPEIESGCDSYLLYFLGKSLYLCGPQFLYHYKWGELDYAAILSSLFFLFAQEKTPSSGDSIFSFLWLSWRCQSQYYPFLTIPHAQTIKQEPFLRFYMYMLEERQALSLTFALTFSLSHFVHLSPPFFCCPEEK